MTTATITRKPLDKALRSVLESTVVKARDIAEDAARQSLKHLAVGDKDVPIYFSDEQRRLRNRLRAHGRLLGDNRKATGEQGTHKLIAEVAYEHWHRMLFARFLEQNNLLMYDPHTSVTLKDCQDLVQDGVFQDEFEKNCKNGWELAGVLASKMLPQIFRIDSPVFEFQFALELQRELEGLVMSLSPDVFQAQDSLGWVYQFWQSKRKDEVNKSEVKIGADELSPVTQLFTEPYMVSFLLDNSLGAWWAGKTLTEQDWLNAETEEELREKAAIAGVPLDYLRFVKENRRWHPASGFLEGWPNKLSELKIIDPCCGSGHFLVAAFSMLVPIRMASDKISVDEAINAVLTDNLYGLELDQRCVELAAFALAFEAWRYPNSDGYRKLPDFNIACCGLSMKSAKDEWKELSKKAEQHNMSIALDWMYQTFKDAPILGSLINPSRSKAAKIVATEDLTNYLSEMLDDSQKRYDGNRISIEASETRILAKGMATSLKLLSSKYHLVLTNVPYLKAGDQCGTLKEYCEKHYPNSKFALESTFIERCHEFLEVGGCSALVTQQYWLFLKYYNKLREKYIRDKGLGFIARLGPGAFEEIGGEVVNVCLQLTFNESSKIHYGLDVSNAKGTSEKSNVLTSAQIQSTTQKSQLANPDFRISFEIDNTYGMPLSKYSDFGKGSVSGDGPHYIRKFWEFSSKIPELRYWLNSPDHGDMFSGRQDMILWGGEFDPTQETGFGFRGQRVHGKNGLAIGKAGNFRFTPYYGELFDDNLAVLRPYQKSDLEALWCFSVSGNLQDEIKKLDKKMSVTAGTFTKIRVDLNKLKEQAALYLPNGLPKPFTNNPAQWIFHGHPCGSVVWDDEKKWTHEFDTRIEDNVLQVAVARLLGYQWPAELDPEMVLAEDQRAWVNRCAELTSFVDDDGIACLTAVRSESPAALRLEAILEVCYGHAWTTNLKNQLLDTVGSKSLAAWLRDKFFEQHCKLFQNRPFIWQIWDGLKDGFSVLINYHKLDKAGLERLIYTYLGDWIRTQQAEMVNGVDGADVRLAAAQSLKVELEKILEGEKPYDIFVRWKALSNQAIGWNPDLNDGVRLNIRPFILAKDMGKKGAGVLRAKPNIKWSKDRGTDVDSAPWFKLGPEYGEKEGARINEHHLTLAEKQAARKQGEES